MSSRVLLTPLARSIARSHHLTQELIESIKGSGWEGRILQQDLVSYLQQKKNLAQAQVSTLGISKEDLHLEFNLNPLLEWIAKNKIDFEKQHGVELHWMPLFAMLLIRSFRSINTLPSQSFLIHLRFVNQLDTGQQLGIENAGDRNLVGLCRSYDWAKNKASCEHPTNIVLQLMRKQGDFIAKTVLVLQQDTLRLLLQLEVDLGLAASKLLIEDLQHRVECYG